MGTLYLGDIMVKISCSVQSCVYNKYHSCINEDILIKGENAKMSKETICSTFKERRIKDLKAEFSNLDFPKTLTLNVNCNAKNCIHNNLNRCLKEKIHIDNNYYLGKVRTKCSSFEEKIC